VHQVGKNTYYTGMQGQQNIKIKVSSGVFLSPCSRLIFCNSCGKISISLKEID